MQDIAVVPAGQGWALYSTAFDNGQYFKSGAAAEAAAVRLAQVFAKAGQDVAITVTLRDGSLGRRLVVPARRRRGGAERRAPASLAAG